MVKPKETAQKNQSKKPESSWGGDKNRRKYGWKQRRPNRFKSVTENIGQLGRTTLERITASQNLPNLSPWGRPGYIGGAVNLPVRLPAILP